MRIAEAAKRPVTRSRSLLLLASICAITITLLLHAQQASPPEDTTTQQHLETEAWWPTRTTAPNEAYAGSAACIRCHAEEHAVTSMQRAALHAGEAGLFRQILPASVASPAFQYHLAIDTAGLDYTVSTAQDTLAQPLDWVMGVGDMGQTFVYQRQDHWYQSRLSVYRNAPQLDVTTGLHLLAAGELTEALGKVLSPEEVRHCFSCHTVHATTSRGFNPAKAEPGLGCEACHGPAAAHVASNGRTAVFNPAKLAPADSIDYCGACHRTTGDVSLAANKANDSSVVRFQPYRLQKSRCWRATQDERLTCVGCHDPHLPLERNVAAYDKKCLSCHAAALKTTATHAGKVCPRAASACVSCHMPKIKVASMHAEFTDHDIRVAAAFIP